MATDVVFRLEVIQQPQRARMCGFGDKDRRPITPPPCICLVVTDRITGQEVDVSYASYPHPESELIVRNRKLDISFYVLTVDLWDAAAINELNLVVHPSSSYSTSSAPVNPVGQQIAYNPGSGTYLPSQTHRQTHQAAYKAPLAPGQSFPGNASLPLPTNYANQGHHATFGMHQSTLADSPLYQAQIDTKSEKHLQNQLSMHAQHPPGSFTRNLIGSLVASAFKLYDPRDRLGIWFVLQDLSIRTEGCFRLKFNFVDLSSG